MDDLLAVARAVAALADNPITLFKQLPAPENPFADVPYLGELMGLLAEAPPDARNAALAVLVPALGSADAYQGNRLALICGTIVEQGGDAWRVAPALLKRLPGQLALAARVAPFVEEESTEILFARDPDGTKAWESLRFLLLATMTILCRDLPSRVVARTISGIVDALPALADYSAEAGFLDELLSYTDGMEVTVLHVAERKGWRVRLEAIRSQPHFHTLLQARLIGDPLQGLLPGTPPDPNIVAVARNEARPSGDQTDYARFECYFASALRPDGSVNGMWVTAETTPNELYPLIDGERVVLLAPLLFAGRGWDASFFANIHDALRSDVKIVEALSEAQVMDWLERIHAARRNGFA